MDAQDTVPYISTHALREEGDLWRQTPPIRIHKFLPTPSARRATKDGADEAEE